MIVDQRYSQPERRHGRECARCRAKNRCWLHLAGAAGQQDEGPGDTVKQAIRDAPHCEINDVALAESYLVARNPRFP